MKTIENPTAESEPLVLDVRPLFERGESPCGAIDGAVAKLGRGQSFVLLVPFEPHPLIARLGREGFVHKSVEAGDGSWRIEFCRGACNPPPVRVNRKPDEVDLDVRGLEPPEPLVKALEALRGLKTDRCLRMRSDRRPIHLFEQLETRGFAYDCTEQDDHSFITKIWHDHEPPTHANGRC